MVQILTDLGWKDYFDEKPYDRTWIYRGWNDNLILDLIWSLPNHRLDVDEGFLTRGKLIHIYDTELRLLPIEELMWSKIYVMQRERCDWPDLFNIMNYSSQEIDYGYLIDRMGQDAALFGGVLSAYRWLCPLKAQELPSFVWERTGLVAEFKQDYCADGAHADLLDTREWFGPKDDGAYMC
jgi:hypothetical protein